VKVQKISHPILFASNNEKILPCLWPFLLLFSLNQMLNKKKKQVKGEKIALLLFKSELKKLN